MNQKVTMKEIPSADRPYEKCEKLGAGALSDTELLCCAASEPVREGRMLSSLPAVFFITTAKAEFSVFISSVLSD